jgi:hypothetical protein
MSDTYILAIDLAKRSFQVCATAQGGACVDAPDIARRFFDYFHGLALLSLVCQASLCGLKCATGRHAVRRARSTSVQRAFLLEPQDWLPRPEH